MKNGLFVAAMALCITSAASAQDSKTTESSKTKTEHSQRKLESRDGEKRYFRDGIRPGYDRDPRVRERSREIKPGERAEQFRRSPERSKVSRADIAGRLNLTADQKAKFDKIRQKSRAEMQKMRKEEQKFRTAQMQRYRKLASRSDQDLQDLLTEEQRKTYQEIRKERLAHSTKREDKGRPTVRRK